MNIIKENIKVSNIINYLKTLQLTKAYKLLEEYLITINKKDYHYLILNLIKISILKNDKEYKKVLEILTSLSDVNYIIQIEDYIFDLSIALINNDLEIAKSYYKILKKYKELVPLQFKEIYEKIIQRYNNKINGKDTTSIENLTNTLQNENIPTQEDIEFVNNCYKELMKTKEIILLQDVNKKQRHILHELIKKYPNISSYSIGKRNSNKYVIIKYQTEEITKEESKELDRKVTREYRNGNFEEVIKTLKILLACYKYPKQYIYSTLGTAYLKMGNIEKAIDYLNIATKIYSTTKKGNDYTKLIEKLKKSLEQNNEAKPTVIMHEEDFKDKEYSKINLDMINKLIDKYNTDLETLCKKLGYNDEQLDIIMLMCAKVLYIKGNFKKGDQFIKSYEKSPFKTKITKDIYEEIKQNKKLYINRKDNYPNLLLHIKPRVY